MTEFLLLFATSGHLRGSSFMKVNLLVVNCASEEEFLVVALTAKLLFFSPNQSSVEKLIERY